ncbi:MAG: beta-lactamase-like protein [Olpidium bornovanus]|uniref:Cleavage and polyadenylation specificity factor subunit 2 n=1 Tax=Olpidium bornovanus TaxID=278681 RepID=A0A8H7ZQB3_9FUNG|nr:MAG: beta-lactamase-like protein [Olpidium bornovanus]
MSVCNSPRYRAFFVKKFATNGEKSYTLVLCDIWIFSTRGNFLHSFLSRTEAVLFFSTHACRRNRFRGQRAQRRTRARVKCLGRRDGRCCWRIPPSLKDIKGIGVPFFKISSNGDNCRRHPGLDRRPLGLLTSLRAGTPLAFARSQAFPLKIADGGCDGDGRHDGKEQRVVHFVPTPVNDFSRAVSSGGAGVSAVFGGGSVRIDPKITPSAGASERAPRKSRLVRPCRARQRGGEALLEARDSLDGGCLAAVARRPDPLCYLLEIDSVHVLLDCGWFESFDTHSSHHLKHLRRVAKQVDFVLLSHGDVAHLGAYPYAFGHLGLNCPAYATLPVHHMGKLTVLDALKSKLDSEPFDLFTKDDINAAFDRITQLRYSQPTALTVPALKLVETGHRWRAGKCKGITITAYSAGHTIGGTIWKIKKDTDEIVYARSLGHQKDCEFSDIFGRPIVERHLNGTALHGGGAVLEALARPSLLITDSYNANSTQPSRKNRDAALFGEK